MEVHQILSQHYTASLTGVTAFSALPDAPVQPERHSRVRAFLGALRQGRVEQSQPQPRRRAAPLCPADA
jgi:hypothetical protein